MRLAISSRLLSLTDNSVNPTAVAPISPTLFYWLSKAAASGNRFTVTRFSMQLLFYVILQYDRVIMLRVMRAIDQGDVAGLCGVQNRAQRL